MERWRALWLGLEEDLECALDVRTGSCLEPFSRLDGNGERWLNFILVNFFPRAKLIYRTFMYSIKPRFICGVLWCYLEMAKDDLILFLPILFSPAKI